jgi:DNA-binding transcriptional LysR family regulator
VVSTANYFLTPLIAAYSERYPGVRISLQVANRETLLSSLADHRTDIAITGEPPQGVDVEAQRFMDNPLVVIANPNHPLAQLESVALPRLRDERLVVRELGSGTRAATERHFAEHKSNFILGCELNSNEAIKQAVQAGLGLGVVSLQTIELELETRRLIVLPVESFPIVRHWFVVHRRDKRLSASSKAFRDLLLSQVPIGGIADSPSPAVTAARSARRDLPRNRSTVRAIEIRKNKLHSS